MNTIPALQQNAVKAAQENRWKDAIEVNLQILQADTENVSALNRLGFCYLQTANPRKAKEAYEKVIHIDTYNGIAKKYLTLLSTTKHIAPVVNGMHQETFIEEPGKTKTVPLCRVADPSIMSSISISAPCKLIVKNHRIAVETESGTYLGSLPDDLSHHLTKLMKGGNVYKAVVKAVSKTCCSVFLKELKRSKKFAYTTSFPTNTHAAVGMHEELLIDQAPLDLSETGQEEESGEDTSGAEEEPRY